MHGTVRKTLPRGAQSVKCAACNYITPTGPEGSRGSGGRRDAGGPHMVVVENPPTIDEKGKVISNMAVGVAEDLKS